MQPTPVCVIEVGSRAFGVASRFSIWLLAGWWCVLYPLLDRMPQRAEQSLATGVSMRKRMYGLWVEMRAMMSVFDGLCRLVFCVFCVMMGRSVYMSVSCSFFRGL
jgi:hypothetical protein